MDRRAFLATLTGGLLAAPLAAEAQPVGKVARIGYLVTGSLESLEPTRVDALRQGLREHGYVEGQNLVIEYRAADGRVERLPALAAELARLTLRGRSPRTGASGSSQQVGLRRRPGPEG